MIRIERYAAAVLPAADSVSQLESEIQSESVLRDDLERRAYAHLRGDPTQGDADTFYPKSHASKSVRDFVLEAEIRRRVAARAGVTKEQVTGPRRPRM